MFLFAIKLQWQCKRLKCEEWKIIVARCWHTWYVVGSTSDKKLGETRISDRDESSFTDWSQNYAYEANAMLFFSIEHLSFQNSFPVLLNLTNVDVYMFIRNTKRTSSDRTKTFISAEDAMDFF